MTEERLAEALRTMPSTHYVVAVPASWTKAAKCLDKWEDYDTPEGKRVSNQKAERLCAGCPVKDACLHDALEEEGLLRYPHRDGIRGGLTPMERSKIAHLTEVAETGKCPCGQHEFDESQIRWDNDRPLCRIQAQPSQLDGKRYKHKFHECPVCHTKQGYLSRHISRHHPDYNREEVA